MSKLNSRILIAALTITLLLAGIFASSRGTALYRNGKVSTGVALASAVNFASRSHTPITYSTNYYGRMYQEMNDLRDCFGDPALGPDD